MADLAPMMRRIIIISLLMLSALGLRAQVYVATDKNAYVSGERIWCSVFCPADAPVAYLELVSTEGSAARTRIFVRDGRGGGSLSIPFGTPTGNYMLYAYTGSGDADARGPVLAVYNVFSTERVKDGVEIVETAPGGAGAAVSVGYGLSASTAGGIVLENTSGHTVSCCVSLTRSDSLVGDSFRSIAGFSPGVSGAPSLGETLMAVLDGKDAAAVAAALDDDWNIYRAYIAVPGSKTDCYAGDWTGEGFAFHTENIFGESDMVFLLDGLEPGLDCWLRPVSPFCAPRPSDLPKLQLCRSQEEDLLRRGDALAEDLSADSLAVSLPLRREHFFLTHECISYILDDYTRFPTMEEVFVEITPNIKLRRHSGKPQVYVLLSTSVLEATPRWGEAAVMIDGVPVPDHKLIETYDPAIVKVIETYPYKYEMGGRLFDGVVNLVTFKGNMPGVLFDDNVRIYDFQGCSWPQEHRGSETPYWHPLLSLGPGESIELPAEALQPGVDYILSVDGLSDGGRPVYLRKTFTR
jgi:hypothetical protein